MFDPDSRYAPLAQNVYESPDGRQIRYVTRRFLPRATEMTTLTTLMIQDSDRLDILAHRAFGNPLLYWQICDANEAMHPASLTAQPGEEIHVGIRSGLPQPSQSR